MEILLYPYKTICYITYYCRNLKNNHIFRIQDIVLDNNTSVDTKQLMILADSLQDNSLIRISLKNMNIDDLLFDKIIDKI